MDCGRVEAVTRLDRRDVKRRWGRKVAEPMGGEERTTTGLAGYPEHRLTNTNQGRKREKKFTGKGMTETKDRDQGGWKQGRELEP